MQLQLHLTCTWIPSSPSCLQQSSIFNIFSQPNQEVKKKADKHRRTAPAPRSAWSIPHPIQPIFHAVNVKPHTLPTLTSTHLHVDFKTSDFVSAPKKRGIPPARPGASLLTAVGRTHPQLRHATVVDRLTQNSSWALPLLCMHLTWG